MNVALAIIRGLSQALSVDALNPDDVVEIRLRADADDPLVGRIVADCPARLLIETVVDGAFHGWRIVPTDEVSDIARTPWTTFATRALKDAREALRTGLAPLDADWRTLIRSLEATYGAVAITRRQDANAIYLGRIVRWTAQVASILTVDPDGTIDPDLIDIRLADIALVEFGSPYTTMYTRHVDWAAALERLDDSWR